MQGKIKAGIYMLLLSFILMLNSWPVFANTSSNTENEFEELEKKITELEADVIRLKAREDNYDYLKGDVKDYRLAMTAEINNYRESLDKERTNFLSFIEKIIGMVGILIAATSIIVSFLGYKSFNDFKVNCSSLLQNKFNNVKEQASESMKKLVQDEIISYEEKFIALQQIVHRELNFNKARILLTGYDYDLHEVLNNDLIVLDNSDVRNNITNLPFDIDRIKSNLEATDYDMIVFRYRTDHVTKQDERLRELVGLLIDKDYKKPLLVYTYKEPNVSYQDKDALDKFIWSSFANTPTTLIERLYTFAHALAGKC